MKTKHLLFSLLLILASFFGANKGFSQVVISGYIANPGGTLSDSSFEYVQLIATQDIDFSTDPFTVVFSNNGAATVKGWVNGIALTYGFALTSGSVVKGDIFYVGGAMKKINGMGSTDISSAKWIRAKFTGKENGDGFGSFNATGNLGNGGANADGIAVFNEPTSNIDSSTAPIDVVFFGSGIGTAKPASGGYMVANNDRYKTSQGTFGNGTNIYVYPDVATASRYFKLSGTYNMSTNSWDTIRTAIPIGLTATSVLADIAPAITLFTPAPAVTINSIATPSVNVIQGSLNNPSYHLTCDVLNLAATLDSIKFRTFGSFKGSDIKSFGYKLWYSANATFSTSDSLIDSADAKGPGDLWFKNLSFQIPVNSSAHFFVTTNFASMATLGDTFYIDSLLLSDVHFATAKKSGANPQSRSGVLTVISSSSPILNISSLNLFKKQVVNTTSAEQSYTIIGGNLFPAVGNIKITTPPGFEISFTSGSGYVDSFLTLPYTQGAINPVDVFVVFKPKVIKTYSENIAHVGGNTSLNLPVTGYGISADTIAPIADTAYALNVNTVIVKFNEAVDITAETKSNYVILGGVSSAVRDASLKTITLTLAIPLVKGTPKDISVENISDTCSNHNLMAKARKFKLFVPAELTINELLAKTGVSDQFIELYNPNLTTSISLKGWFLTNDSANLTKWAFPDTAITAAGYIVIWDNTTLANPGLHCSFKLNNAAHQVVLRSNTSTTVAYTKFPTAKADTSWGRIPNGTGSYAYTKPTPGAANVLYPKPIPTYTIAQVRTNNAVGQPDSLNVYCKLVGVVYGVNFSKSGYSFTIIDNTGGMNIFKSNTTINPPYTVKEGDKVRTVGKISFYNGLTELAIDTIVKVDSNQNLKSALLVSALDESTESNLIKLENLRLVDTALWPKVAGTTAVNVKAYTSTNDTFELRIHFKCDLQGTPAPIGKFNITGIGCQYDATSPYLQYYQIWPRYKSDLVVVTGIQQSTNQLGLELYPNPNNGQFVLDNPSKLNLNISVLNSVGQLISNNVSSQSTITLNITTGKGLYFVKAVATNGQTSTMKVLVK